MNTHTEKKQVNKNQSANNAVAQKQSHGTATFEFVDNRPEAVAQLRGFQDMADNSSQANQAVQLQTMANHHSEQQQSPVQRQPSKSGEIAQAMGQQHGVDTSALTFKHNSSFPASVGAAATIQGKEIHFGPGHDSTKNIKHEVGHAIDNAINGTPKGDTVVNGQKVDATREAAADRMMNTPLQLRSMTHKVNGDDRLGKEASVTGAKALKNNNTYSATKNKNIQRQMLKPLPSNIVQRDELPDPNKGLQESNGNFFEPFQQSLTKHQLNDFLTKYPEAAKKSMYDVVDDIIKKETVSENMNIGVGYALKENPDGLVAKHMTSHAWSETFGAFMSAINQSTNIQDTDAVWICAFANHQINRKQQDEKIKRGIQPAGPAIEDQLDISPFENVIVQFSTKVINTILTPGSYRNDDTGKTSAVSSGQIYDRAWCVFELLKGIEHEKVFEMNSATSDEALRALGDEKYEGNKLVPVTEEDNTNRILEVLLGTVNTAVADCWGDDKDKIYDSIKKFGNDGAKFKFMELIKDPSVKHGFKQNTRGHKYLDGLIDLARNKHILDLMAEDKNYTKIQIAITKKFRTDKQIEKKFRVAEQVIGSLLGSLKENKAQTRGKHNWRKGVDLIKRRKK